MKPEKAPHLQVGETGEDIIVKHLVKHGYKILKRNYRKKWGEIDIVAEKKKILYFVEVKAVSSKKDFDDYIPEENVHRFKRKRLARTINTYLAEKNVTHETEFQVDIASVYINRDTEEYKIRYLENVLL